MMMNNQMGLYTDALAEMRDAFDHGIRETALAMIRKEAYSCTVTCRLNIERDVQYVETEDGRGKSVNVLQFSYDLGEKIDLSGKIKGTNPNNYAVLEKDGRIVIENMDGQMSVDELIGDE